MSVKTITLTDKQDQWIKSCVASGDFTNESEFIRDVFRRHYLDQVAELRAALITGEQSGEADCSTLLLSSS